MIGQTISHYRIVAKLGEGGMGVVYKAEDLKLGRAVALKFLTSHLIESEEHKARFLHEARAAALLDHPNICTVFEIDEVDGQAFLAMAFLEGHTLKQKIAARPLPLSEAIEIATQIGQGLQAAHDKGVVHRDIKPANIMITPQGQVKIMDFGLAQLSNRTRLTATGIKLGTPAYMSPEQTEGKPADRRTDIWALGVVLYEMISGRAPFPGEVEAAVAHAILYADPEPLTALRRGVPMDLDRVSEKALAKDPGDRYQHVEDMLVDLRKVRTSGPGAAISSRQPLPERAVSWKRYAPWIAVALLGVAAAVVAVLMRPDSADKPPLRARLVIPIPAGQQLPPAGSVPFDVSPDGARLVYAASEAGITRLYLRNLDDFDSRPLPGTDGASDPFFAPDGQWIGFVARGRLLKVSVAVGAPVQLCEVNGVVRGASWGPDNTIVFSSQAQLWRVPAAGGIPEAVSTPAEGERHWSPRHLPHSDWLLCMATKPGSPPTITLLSAKTGEQRTLLPGKQASYVPTGHLVYGLSAGIQAVPFDLESLRISGGSVSVLDDVYEAQATALDYFRVTEQGALFYVPGRNEHSLVRVTRDGRVTPLTKRRAGYRGPRVSPDGKRIAVVIDPPDEGPSDIWILDIERDAFSRLTSSGHNLTPIWTVDGNRVVWSLWAGDVQIYWQAADGGGKPELFLGQAARTVPRSFSSDGRTLFFNRWEGVTGSQNDVWALPLEPKGEPHAILSSAFDERDAQLSPDGRWLAYISDESGEQEVYVQRTRPAGRKWRVSSEGGRGPQWSDDARELFFVEGTRMMAVSVGSGDDFTAGKPALLFDRPDLTIGDGQYDAVGDGFVMVQRDPLSMLTEFRVVTNWSDELKRLSPRQE